jgi:hypothetical protein
MKRVQLKVDQWIRIGQDMRISPTDIDFKGVRLLARGRVLGGPNDGASFETVHEMTIGSSVHLSPHAAVTLVSVGGNAARIDVFVPANVSVQSE